MSWSWRLGRIAGIDIKVHWTFLIILLWVAVSYLIAGESVAAALYGVGMVLAIFACVVLHELGHALMARHYGIPTRDITLLPIGGVAQLARIPEKPKEEMMVAIAGPAVNVVIAIVLACAIGIMSGFTQLVPRQLIGSSSLLILMWLNLFLVVFNLLPAFPMDGGRVFRAWLAMKMDYVKATNIAAWTGEAMAILFGIAGLFFNPLLVLIALFVFLGAESERQSVHVKHMVQGLTVRDAMLTDYETLSPQQTLNEAVDLLLAGDQHDFPVLQDGQWMGLLQRSDLIRGLKDHGKDSLVEVVMMEDCDRISPTQPLEKILSRMRSSRCQTFPVMEEDQLIGLISAENIGELIMVRSALEEQAGPPTKDPEKLVHVA
ncbi:Zn-dependent protease [Planctomycetales bacterium 10988]|nr:Zn-dependent protease [Planctomycetales bacterium 10988]